MAWFSLPSLFGLDQRAREEDSARCSQHARQSPLQYLLDDCGRVLSSGALWSQQQDQTEGHSEDSYRGAATPQNPHQFSFECQTADECWRKTLCVHSLCCPCPLQQHTRCVPSSSAGRNRWDFYSSATAQLLPRFRNQQVPQLEYASVRLSQPAVGQLHCLVTFRPRGQFCLSRAYQEPSRLIRGDQHLRTLRYYEEQTCRLGSHLQKPVPLQ